MLNSGFRTRSLCRSLSCSSRALVSQTTATPIRPWSRFTILFYSSIISTAAAADAGFKQKRRRRLDTAISELERSLHSASEPPSSTIAHATLDELNDPHLLHHETSASTEQTSLEKGQCDSRQLLPIPSPSHQPEQDLEYLKDIITNYVENINDGHVNIERRSWFNPHSLYASTNVRHAFHRPMSAKRMALLEHQSAKLATRLLLEVTPKGSAPVRFGAIMSIHEAWVAKKQTLRKVLNELEERIGIVETSRADSIHAYGRLQFPRYTEFHGDEHHGLTKELGEILRLHGLGRKTFRRTISEISYHLLMSPTAPEIGTYNLLINRFSRFAWNNLAEMVIEAVFDSTITPNEMTVTAILSHYDRKHDLQGFNHYVSKYAGGYYGGMMLASAGSESDTTTYRGKSIRLMHLTPKIAYSIIQGYVKFQKQHIVSAWLRRMRDNGIEPDLQLMNVFLKNCGIYGRFDEGIETFRTIQQQFFNIEAEPLQNLGERKKTYRHALWLCKTCEKPEMFKSIYIEGFSKGFTLFDLLTRPPKRSFTRRDDWLKQRERHLHILEHRLRSITEDLKDWALQLLASKIFLSGLPIETVVQAFQRHGTEGQLHRWLSERSFRVKREWTHPWRMTNGEERGFEPFKSSFKGTRERTHSWHSIKEEEQRVKLLGDGGS